MASHLFRHSSLRQKQAFQPASPNSICDLPPRPKQRNAATAKFSAKKPLIYLKSANFWANLSQHRPLQPYLRRYIMANIHNDTQSDIHSNNAKAKLHMVLGRLLDGVSDDDLQQIQTEVDETETLAVKGGGHHDHDHPTLE